MSVSLLRAENIYKCYPGTIALNNVSASFESGKIHAFVGKNGSGKSTLLKIFAGAVQKDGGKIWLDEKELALQTPMDASNYGIATIYQELSVIPGISVAENILIGRLPQKKSGLIDWKKTYAVAEECMKKLEIDIPVRAMVEELTVSQRQMVEIAKAMCQEPMVLQLDEPTSALSQSEVKTLFKLLRKLKKRGVIIIYVSHRLQELWEIADTCTVLRDGHYIGTRDLHITDRKEILHMMFGNTQISKRPDLEVGDETILSVKNLTSHDKFENVSFELKKGEVLGIAGMMGSGRSELLRAIFGADSFETGEVWYEGKQITQFSPEHSKKLGIAMVQEDRKSEGIIAEDSIAINMTLASIDDMGTGFRFNQKKADGMVEEQIKNLQIKLASSKDSINSLSGGNQQKVIVGRWLNIRPHVIIFDEPSRGIDVEAKQQIFRIIWDLSRKGISSIIVSSELEELIEVCTRILIMRQGKLCGEASMEDLTVDNLYLMCMGG